LGMEEGIQKFRGAANILNKQTRTNKKMWFSSLGVGNVLTVLHHKS